eukprot:gene3343-biopygen5857
MCLTRRSTRSPPGARSTQRARRPARRLRADAPPNATANSVWLDGGAATAAPMATAAAATPHGSAVVLADGGASGAAVGCARCPRSPRRWGCVRCRLTKLRDANHRGYDVPVTN